MKLAKILGLGALSRGAYDCTMGTHLVTEEQMAHGYHASHLRIGVMAQRLEEMASSLRDDEARYIEEERKTRSRMGKEGS